MRGKVARLPIGLRKLVLRKKLSAQFIHALDGAENLLDQEEDDGSTFAIATSIDRLLKIPEVTYLERLLALTLLGYLLYSKGNLKLTVIGLQAHVRLLPARRKAYVSSQLEEDALDWAALMLCATTVKGSDTWKWADRILNTDSIQFTLMSEDRQKLLEEAFFKLPRPERRV